MAIDFFIDGKPFSAEPGETILEVARRNGIEIPSLCRDFRVTKTTSCFVCVVKDAKTGKFLPSCSSCPSNGQQIESNSDEVLDMRRTALNLLLSEHRGDCEAPCQLACPAHACVEEYVRAGRNGDFIGALKLIKQRIPMPLSVGRVCPRFCEKDCRRNVDGEPVAINEFKRTSADLHYDEYMEELPPFSDKKVAIIGAGPAGLSTAYYLRLGGVAPVIFENMPKAGGMLRYGIPEYRLPKSILDREIAHFVKMGVVFNFNCKVDENKLAELAKEFDAVVIAIGCWKGSGIRCEGEELATSGIDFLRNVIENNCKAANPGKTIVIGGGNTAMDCLRTSVRLGAPEVTCFYRRTEKEMPAEKIELLEAREEGINFEFLVAPVKLEKRDNKLVLTCRRMELGEPDASGRRKPVEIVGSDFETVADTVIAAIGQKPLAPSGVAVDRFGCVCDERFFAAGDCSSGAATAVEGLASGRKVANSILNKLLGIPQETEPTINVSRGHWQDLRTEDLVYLRDNISKSPREKLDYISIEERKNSFKEVTSSMKPKQLMSEGQRCLECSCTDKKDCHLRKYAEMAKCDPEEIRGAKQPLNYDTRHPLIIQDRGKCVKCGLCVKMCKEIVGQGILSQKKRGFSTVIGTIFDSAFPQNCADCGKCIEICPTGALDWRNKA